MFLTSGEFIKRFFYFQCPPLGFLTFGPSPISGQEWSPTIGELIGVRS